MGIIDTIRREWMFLTAIRQGLAMTTPIARTPNRTLADVMEECCTRFADLACCISQEHTLTYREFGARINQYAHWASRQQLKKGDVVAVMMPNSADYLALWLGITRMGGIAALINTNLMDQALSHCLKVAAPTHLIVDHALMPAVMALPEQERTSATLWSHGAPSQGQWLDQAVSACDTTPIPPDQRPTVTIEDKALYIYTSGTTGLPKAANINHYRLMAISHGFSGVMGTTQQDRIYACLPMYHTVGGIIAPFSVLLKGGSVVIRPKFSAKDFWADVTASHCTIVQYIGELCRYLVNAPTHPDETRHQVRMFCGNGLRPDIWKKFQTRFAIPRIFEFYAATEGNVALFNIDGREGAVGRIPWYMRSRFPVRIIRYDAATGEPIRNAQGLCEQCAIGETGEIIGRVVNDPEKPASRFEGYADPQATRKKLLQDVFEPGDSWFRSGDLMRQDAQGYFYFVDRVGDTYRWKGENIATAEVSAILSQAPCVTECAVYGMAIAGYDGKAGMAALVTTPDFDLAAFADHVTTHLPEYERPVFLRQEPSLETTGTFKQRKLDLMEQGCDPRNIESPLHVFNTASKTYIPLTPQIYDQIVSGAMRL